MASSISLDYQLKNWSSMPVYFVDGWGEVIVLPPLLTSTSGAPPDLPPDFIGKIVAERNILTYYENQGDNWDGRGAAVVADPPLDPMARNSWYIEIPQMNAIVFGSENRARLFAAEDQNLSRYRNRTAYGTRFLNGLNYSFINCTQRPLWLVDGFGGDIVEIPPGEDAPFMYDDSNTCRILPNGPYLRIIRYRISETAGMMLQYQTKIIPWDDEVAQENPFDEPIYNYFDEINALVFLSREEAEGFLRVHPSVAAYMRSIFYLDLKDEIEDLMEGHREEIRVTRNRLVWLFTTLTTLQIGGVIGTFLVDQLSITAAEKRKERERERRRREAEDEEETRRSKTGGPIGKGAAKLTAAFISNVAQNIRRR